jgi:hypothetical protein
MSDDFGKFTAPRADEVLHQGIDAPVTFGIDPEDGLATTKAPENFDKLPVLSVETLVCMADTWSFVIRATSDGSIWLMFEPKEVQRLPNGNYVVPLELMKERSRGTALDFSIPDMIYADTIVLIGKKNVVRVEPIRPACKHYLRMQTDLSVDRTRRFQLRACMAQKGEDGEYYSVGDSLIAACNIREPRHFESEALLDKFDEEKINQGRERERLGQFDIERELEAEAKTGNLGVLG